MSVTNVPMGLHKWESAQTNGSVHTHSKFLKLAYLYLFTELFQ